MVRIKSRKIREDGEDAIVEVDGVKLDASQAEVIYQDEEKDIQVVASPDPENENSVTIAVLTASEEDVEDEKVLGSASVEGGEGEGNAEESLKAEEARKAARREAFRKRLEARRAAKKSGMPARDEARMADFRKRLEARRAEKKAESRKASIAEARAKFRSKIGKKA